MKLIRQFILLALTFVVLLSSTGISVGMHLCGGELRDITFFGTEAECPMEQQKEQLPACHKQPSAAKDKTDCCNDHTLVFNQADAVSDHKAQLLTKTLDLTFVAAFHAVILQLFASEATVEPIYTTYKSPPISRDIPVLVQSFLL